MFGLDDIAELPLDEDAEEVDDFDRQAFDEEVAELLESGEALEPKDIVLRYALAKGLDRSRLRCEFEDFMRDVWKFFQGLDLFDTQLPARVIDAFEMMGIPGGFIEEWRTKRFPDDFVYDICDELGIER